MPKRIDNPTPKQLAQRIKRNKWHAENPHKAMEYWRKRIQKDADAGKNARRKFRINNPESEKKSQRKSRLKKSFGLTLEQYDDILRYQGFACAICGNGKSGGRGLWHVDHCHQTKRIRGLLCHNCNTALGLFKENPIIIRSAMTYLKKER